MDYISLFTHMDIIPTIIVIVLVMVLFFISNYRHYLSKIKSGNRKLDQNLKLAQELIAIGSLVLILVSSTVYYFEKKVEYKKHFSVWKFVFGKKVKSTPSKAKFFSMLRK